MSVAIVSLRVILICLGLLCTDDHFLVLDIAWEGLKGIGTNGVSFIAGATRDTNVPTSEGTYYVVEKASIRSRGSLLLRSAEADICSAHPLRNGFWWYFRDVFRARQW